jgi:hypothetical protein
MKIVYDKNRQKNLLVLPYILVTDSNRQQLQELSQEIIEIKKTLRLGTTSLTPLNYQEEMDNFNSSASYSPIYIYKQPELPDFSKMIDEFKLKADRLDVPDDIKEHIFQFLEDQNNLYLTKSSIGTEAFSEHAHRLFDWGTDRLEIILANTPAVEFTMYIEHKLVDAYAIKEKFVEALSKYNLTDFEVRVDEFSPHIVSVGYKSVSIGAAVKRFECNVDRLIVHEIESHAIQTQNMKNSPTPLSEFVKYGNQHLYGEGLAVYNEITTRKITPSAFEIYFNRIKAVKLLDKSFREIYESLCEDLDPKRAFVMTYRVKRGMHDTAQPGGFPKDASYLLGYHEVENLVLENYPKKLLYATKSPILSLLLHKHGLLDLDNVLIPKF